MSCSSDFVWQKHFMWFRFNMSCGSDFVWQQHVVQILCNSNMWFRFCVTETCNVAQILCNSNMSCGSDFVWQKHVLWFRSVWEWHDFHKLLSNTNISKIKLFAMNKYLTKDSLFQVVSQKWQKQNKNVRKYELTSLGDTLGGTAGATSWVPDTTTRHCFKLTIKHNLCQFHTNNERISRLSWRKSLSVDQMIQWDTQAKFYMYEMCGCVCPYDTQDLCLSQSVVCLHKSNLLMNVTKWCFSSH